MNNNSKVELMERFKAACLDPMNFSRRQLAVTVQYNRNTWQIYDNLGVIRIEKNGDYVSRFEINGAFFVQLNKERVQFTLTDSEYHELRLAYFGDIQPDYDYLKKHYDYDKAHC